MPPSPCWRCAPAPRTPCRPLQSPRRAGRRRRRRAAPAAPETEITEQGQEAAMTAQDMQSFDAWLAGFRVLAQAQGVRAQTLDSAFAGLSPSARAIALDQAQPETRASYAGYLARRLTETKVARGRRAVLRAGDALATAQARTGVPASLVAAIWGMETDYGGFQGDFDVVRALATLAWEGRRAALFGEELLVALKLLDEGRLTRADYRGSWAGAYGMTQFMPSTVRDYAIDADGDGTVRLRESLADAMVSTANYLAQSGWRAGQGWGRRSRRRRCSTAGHSPAPKPRPAARGCSQRTAGRCRSASGARSGWPAFPPPGPTICRRCWSSRTARAARPT
ncbi:lytic murein transglycosylase [Hankyongella ginsenosidimutans]|uniref:Lytic murein transglycosylase n=1 Tax=Hankyongella ginsenosidimutans TaxID=1763828 RepID=A0A4D7BY14_9SPHN|nr:lytic murein transglycosylase [Hankyongella ginsenosidimutans]QCI80259.1 lytic murein transglycosylase [Hankyongella ginsenosidimutans]